MKGGIAKYTQSIQKTPIRVWEKDHKDTFPYFKLNQSMKSNKDIV